MALFGLLRAIAPLPLHTLGAVPSSVETRTHRAKFGPVFLFVGWMLGLGRLWSSEEPLHASYCPHSPQHPDCPKHQPQQSNDLKHACVTPPVIAFMFIGQGRTYGMAFRWTPSFSSLLENTYLSESSPRTFFTFFRQRFGQRSHYFPRGKNFRGSIGNPSHNIFPDQ